ncbi:MAG TPA: GNVR domain-containing protein, partial [Deinococcales bacterium]|nr:GNVR domain-containing protein [Deinococcales bacterium]
ALELEPVLSYISEVLETNVRVLDDAVEPRLPAAAGRLLITLIALVVGGLLATIFVFLRAAVQPDPAETTAAPARA